MAAPTPLYMAKSFQGLAKYTDEELDKNKSLNFHLQTVDKMLFAISDKDIKPNQEKVYVLSVRILRTLMALNKHRDPQYAKKFDAVLKLAEEVSESLRKRYKLEIPEQITTSPGTRGSIPTNDHVQVNGGRRSTMDRFSTLTGSNTDLGLSALQLGGAKSLPRRPTRLQSVLPEQLDKWMQEHGKVLVIDTRSTQQHSLSHLAGEHVLHLPESLIAGDSVSVQAIQTFLGQTTAGRLWAMRDSFPEVVLFDRGSTVEDILGSWLSPLLIFINALNKDTSSAAVKGIPKILEGGWKRMAAKYPYRCASSQPLTSGRNDMSNIHFPTTVQDATNALLTYQPNVSGSTSPRLSSLYPSFPSGLQTLHATIDAPDVGEFVTYSADEQLGPDNNYPLPPGFDRVTKPAYNLYGPPPDRPASEKPFAAAPTLPPKPDFAPARPQKPTGAVDTYTMPAAMPMPALARGSGLTGLRNLGNTCYMNSVIQCLSNAMPFSTHFIDQQYVKEINGNNPLGMGGQLAREFGKVVLALWRGQYQYIAPTNLKDTIGRFAPRFAGYEQHDSQELLGFLMDGLHEDLNRSRDRSYVEDPDYSGGDDVRAALASWKNYIRRNNSVVVDLFQGQFRSQLKCLTCGYASITFSPFMYLSVPLPKGKSTIDLHDTIRAFVAKEIVTGDDKWYCRRCKTHRDAEKKLDIWRLPVILVVHVKRFSNMNKKDERFVNFPIAYVDTDDDFHVTVVCVRSASRVQDLCNVDLGQYALGPQGGLPGKYHLSGIVNHWGRMGSGHYTAYCRNMVDKQWYDFDDTAVKSMPESKLRTAGAYFLTYISTSHMPL